MAHILEMAWQFQFKCVKKEVSYPNEIWTKNICLYSGSVELQLHVLFIPVKYTLVCHATWVSWAARHTTVFQ